MTSRAFDLAPSSQLHLQLDRGIPTFAYLYRKGEVWRTAVQEITSDAEAVDTDRMPTYYSLEDCNLFTLLSNFESLPSDWIGRHLILANHPDPERTLGALSNQTTPLFMYQLFDPESVG